MKPLERAISIALEAHAGQVDKAGAPYVLHPLRVMLRMETEAEMMAAVLHDVVEDKPADWPLARLAAEGVPADVVEAVDFLTKRPEEEKDYEAFIRRAGRNLLAMRVKLADLEDNMDLGRIANPSERDIIRVAKYRKAHAALSAMPAPKSPPPSIAASLGKGRMSSEEFRAWHEAIGKELVGNLNANALANNSGEESK